MANAYFELIETSGSATTYASDAATGGPWSPQLQHGGPPNALLAHAAEQVAARETGRTDLHAMRLAAEFVAPVPVADVTVTAQVVRAARTAVLVSATLRAGGRDCLLARVWLVRAADTTAVAPSIEPVLELGGGDPGLGASFPYGDSIDWRWARGSFTEPGPAAVFARPSRPIVADHPLSSLQRAALVGDSASGISAELDWTVWSFLNIDLDVHLSRPIVGDWLYMDAATTLGPAGAALARSSLSDAAGLVGGTAQTLVVEPRRR